jgi:outer membrane protein assembly factor BamB
VAQITQQSAAESPHQIGAGPVRSAWKQVAWVAGVFVVLLSVGMLVSHLRVTQNDPLKSPQLKEYKAKLRLNPMDEPLKQQIRDLDLRLRESHLRYRARMDAGVWLLLGGVAVFILAVTRAAGSQRPAPMPEPKPEGASPTLRTAAQSRWALVITGVGIGALLLGLSSGFRTALPKGPAEVAKLLGTGAPAGTGEQASGGQTAADAASLEELKQNWPCFRGLDGGVAAMASNTPAQWDLQAGAGLAWSAPVRANGFNSPILWGGRAFFSGGDERIHEVFCLDLKNGQVLWRQPVSVPPPPGTPPAVVPESTGYAASTMATDGRRLYVMFAGGELAALTLEGRIVWAKSFGPLKNAYGHATSLATWQDRLLLQLDQGDADDNKSKLYALDGRTGQIVWQRPRKAGSSWASPIVIEAAGKVQIITLAVPFVIAYAVNDGTELWKVDCLNGEVTPSPVFAGGLVLVASPSEKLLAIRPDGQGDVTKTHVAWTAEDNIPDVTSPVSNGELVFTLTTSGMLTCFDVKDGKKQWEHDFEFECHASPSLAGTRLYFFGQKGTAVVVEAARQFKELARAQLSDGFHASPAFAQDKMVLRGVTNVWCFQAAGAGGEIRNPKSEARNKSE